MPSLSLLPHLLIFLASALLWHRLRGIAAFGMAAGFFLVLTTSIILALGPSTLVPNWLESIDPYPDYPQFVVSLFIIQFVGSVISAVSFLIFAYGAKKYVVRDT